MRKVRATAASTVIVTLSALIAKVAGLMASVILLTVGYLLNGTAFGTKGQKALVMIFAESWVIHDATVIVGSVRHRFEKTKKETAGVIRQL